MTIHEHVQEVLSARRDGEASAEGRFLAERHLERCAACREADADFARADEMARELLLPAGPAPFAAALRSELGVDPPAGAPPRRGPRRLARRRYVLSAVAAVLLAAAIVAVPTLVPPGEERPPAGRVALAAVRDRAEEAAASVRSLEGSFTRKISGVEEGMGGTYQFVYQHPGRLRVEGGESAFLRLVINDAPTARRTVWARGEPRATVHTGVALVPPQGPDALAPLTDGYGAWLEGRLSDPDRPARPVAIDGSGRKAYELLLERVNADPRIAGPPSATHVAVWLDTELLLPLRIQYQDRSEPARVVVRREVRYQYDEVNGEVPANAFEPPADARVVAGGSFEPMPLEQALARAGGNAPRVGHLPEPGWELLLSGYAPKGRPTGPEAGNPPGTDLVVAVYGEGLRRLVMTSVRVPEGAVYDNPFRGEGVRFSILERRLVDGAFDGITVYLVMPKYLTVPKDTAPYLWFRDGDLVVTLTGTATPDELIAVAEGLE